MEREERGRLYEQANGGVKGMGKKQKLAAGGKTKSLSDIYGKGTQTERVCETDLEDSDN